VVRTDWPVTQPSELAPNQCLVKLEYSGVCHSDLHIKRNDWGQSAKLPLVGGHEGIGRIVAVGAHSFVDGPHVGDRVGLKWFGNICHQCEFCRTGHESSCAKSRAMTHGFGIHGTFQEYAVSYMEYVTPIPEDVDGAATTPILCAGMTVYRALKRANLTIGQWVAISGAGGGLGHLAVQYACAMGLRVLAIDTGEVKRELALRLGAETWIDFRESEDLVGAVKDATGGGPHAALIAAGDPRPFSQAVAYLRPTGTLIAVGMPGGGAVMSLPIVSVVAKSLHIVGSAIGNRQDVSEALNVVALGKIKCEHEVRELEDINDIFADMEAGRITGRVVVKLTA